MLIKDVLPLPLQAAERSPVQVNPGPEEGEGASGVVETAPRELNSLEVRGSRFSKSAEERQKMLLQRKDELLQQARRYCTVPTGNTRPVCQMKRVYSVRGNLPSFADRNIAYPIQLRRQSYLITQSISV